MTKGLMGTCLWMRKIFKTTGSPWLRKRIPASRHLRDGHLGDDHDVHRFDDNKDYDDNDNEGAHGFLWQWWWCLRFLNFHIKCCSLSRFCKRHKEFINSDSNFTSKLVTPKHCQCFSKNWCCHIHIMIISVTSKERKKTWLSPLR